MLNLCVGGDVNLIRLASGIAESLEQSSGKALSSGSFAFCVEEMNFLEIRLTGTAWCLEWVVFSVTQKA